MNLRRKSFSIPILLLLPTLMLLPAFIATTSAATQPVVLVTKTWGGSVNEVNQSIVLDPNGNAYVTGGTYSFGAGGEDIFLLKYDQAGKLLWQRTWGGSNGTDQGNGVAVDSLGNVYVVGYTNSFGDGGYDVLLLKYDSSGVFQYAKTWGGTGDDFGHGIAIDSSNNIYLSGYSTNTGGLSIDVILLKYNQAGVLLLTGGLDSLADQEGTGVAVDSNGKIYVTGWSQRCCFGGKDSMLLQFNSTLYLEWQHYYGTAVDDVGRAVATDSSGGIYVIGYNSSTSFLLKYNNAGTLQWQKSGCSACGGKGMAVTVNAAGTVYAVFTNIIAGITFTNFWNFTSSGTPLYVHTFYKAAGIDAVGRGIAVDSSGNIYLTGEVNSAPPYNFANMGTLFPVAGSGSDTTSVNPFSINPVGFITSPSGTNTSPSGSQNYGGQTDTFLLKYGPEPTLTFQTSPSTGGSINFNGTTYTNGQTGNYVYGNVTVSATAPTGYTFNSWTATGGLTLASTSSNPTTVTISGSGTLTANYAHLGGTPITPATLILASLIALVTPITIRRRRK